MVNIKMNTLIISILLSFFITLFFYTLDKPIIYDGTPNSIFNISDNIQSEKIFISISQPYFSSIGEVYGILVSPYIYNFEVIELNASTIEGQNFKSIPKQTSRPVKTDFNKSARIGLIDLTTPNNILYLKVYIPAQNITFIPINVSESEVLNSFNVIFLINPLKTPKDYLLLIILFTSILGVIYYILNNFLIGKPK